MLYSKAQLDEKLKSVVSGEEHEILLKIETELRKAFHPATASSFDGNQVERLLTNLDLVRTKD